MAIIKFKIDDKEVQTEEGKSVLQASLEAGHYIPHLCWHPNLSSFGSCRLCIVEIEGVPGLPASCTTPVVDGMVIKSKTPQINKMRGFAMELMLANGHPPDCSTCPKYLSCELQSAKQYLGITEETRLKRRSRADPIREQSLFIHDFCRCVLCGRCVRACHEMRGVGCISFIDKGSNVFIGTGFDRLLKDADCRFCGACVEVCPTGALRDVDKVLKSGKSRKLNLVPCKFTCPAEVDVPRYVRYISQGKYDESYAVVRERLPLPSVCGYICPAFCEGECRRGMVNEAESIRTLKRFVSEHHTDLWKKNVKIVEPTGKKVAILGSGPAGLSAAYYLARKGHNVTIFEQSSMPGGMLRSAISTKRLPRKALNEDIDEILKLGVKLELNAPRAKLDELLEQFNAVLIAIGTTFIGPATFWLKDQGIELNPSGSIKIDSWSLTTNKEGVFAAGDVLIGTISEDFIRGNKESSDNFYDFLVDRLALYRGDSSRSAIQAISSGRKTAQVIDKYLGGDGETDEVLLPVEEPDPCIGRIEDFASLTRRSEPFHSRSPQYAGFDDAESPLSEQEAIDEAVRCLQCDLRMKITRDKYWNDYQ